MGTKQFMRRWLLPPGINEFLWKAPPWIKALWGSRPVKPGEQRKPREQPEPQEKSIVLSPDGAKPAELKDLLTAPYGEIVWVPVEKIRLWGRGLTRQQNQYVRYFVDGLESLRRFYELHQPLDRIQAMFLDSTSYGKTNVQYPSFRNPWSFQVDYKGEGPLGVEHGWQEHGPITNRKLLFEAKRLDYIRTAVSEHGFQKFDDDFIRFGKVLVNDVVDSPPDYVVTVINASHRSALLAAMGWRFIPMVPTPRFPIREVRLSQVENWPGVLDWTFSIDQARAYFLAHFRDPHEVLIPEW